MRLPFAKRVISASPGSGSSSTRWRTRRAPWRISAPSSRIACYVIPTDEELMIARHTLRVLRSTRHPSSSRSGMIDISTLTLLKGKKALVTGIANDQSIAWGCAKAFRVLGADLAVTYLSEKAKPYVEPLAQELERDLAAARRPEEGELEAVFEPSTSNGASSTFSCTRSPSRRRRTCTAGWSTARRPGSCWQWTFPAGRSSAWRSLPSR